MPFDLNTAVPVNQANGERKSSFDLETAQTVQKKPTWISDLPGTGAALLGGAAMAASSDVEIKEEDRAAALRTAGRAFQLIRWPFWRFIEHPISTIVTAAQEPGKESIGKTAGKTLQTLIPFHQIPKEEYGTYGQIWNNYYKSINPGQEAPWWYLAISSFGTAMGLEPAVMRGAAALTEQAATRVATTEEAAVIAKHFQPFKDGLVKRGLDITKLHDEGNVIVLDQGKGFSNELFVNKYLTAVLKGKEIRIPRWSKVIGGKEVTIVPEGPITANVPMPATTPSVGILPTTGKEVILQGIRPLVPADFNQQDMPLPEEQILMHPDVISKLNEMQKILGVQLKISSGFRTPEYNAYLKKKGYSPAPDSLHLQGEAADIPIKKLGLTHQQVIDAALQVGLSIEDISLTPNHVHVELPRMGNEKSPTKLMNVEGKVEPQYKDKIELKKGKSILQAKIAGELAHLDWMEVPEAEQGKGIGSGLYQQFYNKLKDEFPEVTGIAGEAENPRIVKMVNTPSTEYSTVENQPLTYRKAMAAANQGEIVQFYVPIQRAIKTTPEEVDKEVVAEVSPIQKAEPSKRITDPKLKKYKIKQLEFEAKQIDTQMKMYEKRKIQAEANGESTKEIDNKLESLGKQYDYLDSSIAELMISDADYELIDADVLQMKVKDLLLAQEKAVSEGVKKGTKLTKEKVALQKAKAKVREDSKAAVDKMLSDIKNLPTKSLPIEYKDMIDSIKEQFDFTKKTTKALVKKAKMAEFIIRETEAGNEINIPEEDIALLEKTSVGEMSVEDLTSIHRTLTRLAHLGKLKNKLLTNKAKREFEEVKNLALESITDSKGLSQDSSIVKALKAQNKTLKDMTAAAIKHYITIHLRPELMINALDGYKQGINTQAIWDPLYESDITKMVQSEKELVELMAIHKGLNLQEIANTKYDVGRFKGITKNMMMHIYANSFNPHNKMVLENSGITEADISDITAFLSEAEKAAVDNLLNHYDKVMWKRLDEVYSELEGVHLGQEYKYFPIERLEDISYNKELEKYILERNYFRKPGASKGFTKERQHHQKGFEEFDYIGTVVRHWQKTEHYIAFAKSIRDVNKILSNSEMKRGIVEHFGQDYYNVLSKWLKDVAYGGDKRVMSTIDKVSQWARTNYAVSVLGINLLSVLKQPVAILPAMEMAGKAAVLSGVSKFLTNPMKWTEFVDSKSTLVKFRNFTQQRELVEIKSQESPVQKLGRLTGYQWVREKSMLPLLISDKVCVSCIWLGSYDASIADGMSEEDAIAFADRVIRRTQNIAGPINLPDVFRGPVYQQLYTMFKNQPNQSFNLEVESIARLKRGQTKPTKFADEQIFYVLIPALILGLIERKRLARSAGEFIGDTVNEVSGGLLLLGNLINSVQSGYWGAITPLEGYMQDLRSVVGGKELTTKLIGALKLTSHATGLPFTGMKRLITGEPFGKAEKETSKQRSTKRRSTRIRRKR